MKQEDKKEEADIRRQEEENLEACGQMTLDQGPGPGKIHLLSIIGEVEGHENAPGTSFPGCRSG